MLAFAAAVREETGFTPSELSLGGGLGVRYVEGDRPLPPADLVACLAEAVRSGATPELRPAPAELIVEPGRSIAAEAGTTLYTVGTIKEIPGVRTYLSVDGGMGDNIRPALYGARTNASVANKLDSDRTQVIVTVVGSVLRIGATCRRDRRGPAAVGCPPGATCSPSFATGAYNYSAWRPATTASPRRPWCSCGTARGGPGGPRGTFADMAACDVLPPRFRPRAEA